MIKVDKDFNDTLDCTLIKENDYQEFIEDYYDILKSHNFYNLRPKQHYKSNFKGKNDSYINNWINFIQKYQKEFYNKVDEKIIKKIGKFYLVDRGSKETFIFFPFPHVQYLINFRMMSNIISEMKDVNFIFCDFTDMFFTKHGFSKEQCENLVIDEIEEVLHYTGLIKTKRFFNAFCFGFLVSRKLIETRKDLYDQCLLYSPMIHHNVTNRQLDPRHLNFKDDFIEVKLFFFLINMLKGLHLNEFYIPKKNLYINAKLFAAFFDDFSAKKADLSISKYAHLVMTKNDMTVPAENILWDQFIHKYEVQSNPTKHGDILVIIDSIKEYINIVKQIKNKCCD